MPGDQLGAPRGEQRPAPYPGAGCSLRDRWLSCRRSPRDFPWLCRLIMNTCPAVESSQFCAGHPGSSGSTRGFAGSTRSHARGPQDRPRSGGSTRVERVIPGPLGHPEPVGSSHTNRGFSVFTFNPAHVARRVRNPTDPGQPGKTRSDTVAIKLSRGQAGHVFHGRLLRGPSPKPQAKIPTPPNRCTSSRQVEVRPQSTAPWKI